MVIGHQVEPPGAVREQLDLRDGQAVQVEQQRRIVVQARASK
jgi:antitoxin component of MazEF toxin-antitoxin module